MQLSAPRLHDRVRGLGWFLTRTYSPSSPLPEPYRKQYCRAQLDECTWTVPITLVYEPAHGVVRGTTSPLALCSLAVPVL